MDHGIASSLALETREKRAGWAVCLDSRPMDRRLARRNLRTGLITGVIALLMFALTFVAALLYVQ